MKHRKYSGLVSLAFVANACVIAFIWVIQARTYTAQGLAVAEMVRDEFAHDNFEWQSSYWAAIYPFVALAVALAYRLSRITASRLGAVALAAISTLVALSAFPFIYLPAAALLALPVIPAYLCASSNPQIASTGSGA